MCDSNLLDDWMHSESLNIFQEQLLVAIIRENIKSNLAKVNVFSLSEG